MGTTAVLYYECRFNLTATTMMFVVFLKLKSTFSYHA